MRAAVDLIAVWALTACAATSPPPVTPTTAVPPPSLPAMHSEASPQTRCAHLDEAHRLAKEGDARRHVDVDGAAERYQAALSLCPREARFADALAQASERKEDWEKMATALAVAIALRPGFADYHYRRGYALTKLGDAGDTQSFVLAKAPLAECLRLDPGHSACHFLLGVTSEQTLDDQAALEHYTRAIRLNPHEAGNYPPLAGLYTVHKRYAEANQVLREGLRLTPLTPNTREALYEMSRLSFQVAQAQGNRQKMLEAAERAAELAGDEHPEAAFNLGATYAMQDPPEQARAIRWLMIFRKRACRAALASQYRQPCEMTETLLGSLGRQ